jgi:DNA helicase II / ATP-dependent DNA helicase PcrA
MDLFAGLNPQQRAAVETINGRLLILAGAGSGKTRVLTLRMAHLIYSHQVPPQSILGLTFTNKAADEMRHRLASLLSNHLVKQVTLCTFHSFCMQILRNEIQYLGYSPKFTIYDEKDVQRLIQVIARDLLEHEGVLPSLAPTIEMISFAKNKGLSAQEIGGSSSLWHDQFVRTLFERLHNCMRAHNAVDLDSLQSLTLELFEKYPEVLKKYQHRYAYIMIDEYQDTNPVQYRLASLLTAKYQNICVVGDDDQSIYGWRGAEVQNILDFSQANTAIIKLEQNYRSTNCILKAANAVISNNQKRHGKALWSNNGEGEKIEIFFAPSENEEAEAVVCRMDKLREKQGLKWGDMAILYRSNALSRPFEVALIKHAWKEESGWTRGVPYQIFGGLEFYERREVKDLVAYLRVIVNPLDEEALLRIINYPRRGIGEGALDILTAYNRKMKISLWSVLQDTSFSELQLLHPKASKGITTFLTILTEAKIRFSTNRLNEALRWLIETLNYKKAIVEEVKSTQMREFKWENVQEFISSLAAYETDTETVNEIPSLHDFLLKFPLGNRWEKNSTQAKQNNCVTLMTFHGSKGLEFPACFLVGMEDHIIPHEKSVKQTGVEEERRLMYVAITRAMKFLTVSMASRRKSMGVEMATKPSRFLLEIPQECLQKRAWDQF